MSPKPHKPHADLLPDFRRRFWEKVGKTAECWVWTGSKRRGYGLVGFMNRLLSAHRVSYLMAFGLIPRGLRVLHMCDNPACVRPSHLELGTQLENVQDRDAKGRHQHLGMPRGDQHWTRRRLEAKAA